jgi:hypothetical protein
MHAGALVRVAKLEAENEQLRGENRQLQARLFGQRSEHSTSRDRSNHLPGEDRGNEEVERAQRNHEIVFMTTVLSNTRNTGKIA